MSLGVTWLYIITKQVAGFNLKVKVRLMKERPEILEGKVFSLTVE